MQKTEFASWQAYWRSGIRSFLKRIERINLGGIKAIMRLGIGWNATKRIRKRSVAAKM